MKILISLWLWFTGVLFFAIAFSILVVCLFFLPQQTTFKTVRFLFSVLIRIMGIKLVVTGRENIDLDNTYLIMGNHQSLFDIFVIPAAIPLCFVGVEAAYHFKVPVWGYLIRKWGCIPIERKNRKKAFKSLEKAKKALRSGMSIAILPEGTRTLTGEMAPFKKGPFHLARKAESDILPFAVTGLFEFNKKGRLLLNPGKVTLNIGRPVKYDELKDLSIEKSRQQVFNLIRALRCGHVKSD